MLGDMRSLTIVRTVRLTRILLVMGLLLMALTFAPNAMARQTDNQETPQLPRFDPETGRYIVFEHSLIRQGAGWQASTTVTRCIRFTALGRGFRADSHVVSVRESGPKRLVALLSLTQSIRENEHLIFDLNGQGRIIGLRDEAASWDRLVKALQKLRADLPILIGNPAGQAVGARLIDDILAKQAGQQDAYLAEGFLPILAMHPYFSKTDQWPLILPSTQEMVKRGAWNQHQMSLLLKSPPLIPDSQAADNIGQTRSDGHIIISRKDGLLLASQRNIHTRIGDSERMAAEKWQRLELDETQARSKCARPK